MGNKLRHDTLSKPNHTVGGAFSNLGLPGNIIRICPPFGSRLSPSSIDYTKTISLCKGVSQYYSYYYDKKRISRGLWDDTTSPTGSGSQLEADVSDLSKDIKIHYEDGSVDIFSGFHSPALLADGQLIATIDAGGNEITITRDDKGRIAYFQDKNGRTIAGLSYWDEEEYAKTEKAECLKTITDQSGRVVTYNYSAEGCLASVNVAGRETRYDYYNT